MSIQFGNLTNKLKIDKSQFAEVIKNASALNNGGASIFSSGKVNSSDVSNADIETLLQSYIAKNSDITEQNDITQNSDATGVVNENDLEDILSEKSVMKFILGALNLDEENGVEDVRINGQFDERVQQQGTGDCYLLATLKSLSETSQGQEIIKNTITTNSDGSFTVSFPGIERSYTFTAEDIDAADNATIGSTDGSIVGSGMGRYSEGDDDVLLIEMAYEKFRDEAYHGQIPSKPEWPAYVLQSTSEANYNAGKSTLTSGNMSQVMFLLTGEHAEYASGDKISSELDKMNNTSDPFVAYASVYADNGYVADSNGAYYKDASGYYKKVDEKTPSDAQRYTFTGAGSNDRCITLNGVGASADQKIDLTTNSGGGHAITISAVTDDTITIVNPWDSDKKVTVKRSEFEGYITGVQYMKLS